MKAERLKLLALIGIFSLSMVVDQPSDYTLQAEECYTDSCVGCVEDCLDAE